MLVNLMNTGIYRPQFNQLACNGFDETTVGSTAAGGKLGVDAAYLGNRRLRHLSKFARFGEKGLAGKRPLQIVVQTVFVEDFMYPLFQAAVGRFGGKTEVEFHVQAARNHVGGAGTALDIGNLETGGREIGVALIPFGGH